MVSSYNISSITTANVLIFDLFAVRFNYECKSKSCWIYSNSPPFDSSSAIFLILIEFSARYNLTPPRLDSWIHHSVWFIMEKLPIQFVELFMILWHALCRSGWPTNHCASCAGTPHTRNKNKCYICTEKMKTSRHISHRKSELHGTNAAAAADKSKMHSFVAIKSSKNVTYTQRSMPHLISKRQFFYPLIWLVFSIYIEQINQETNDTILVLKQRCYCC